MLTINKRLPKGRGLAVALLKRAATVQLDWDTRQKSRFDATDSMGRHLGVFLPRGTAVRGGDVLVAEDGSLVCVQAAPQAVLRIAPCAQHGSPFDLVRAAYHLGNRHVPIELTPEHLQIEPDHVLADLLRQMHLIVTAMDAPFEPEAGAYAAGHGHNHNHDHGHGHGQHPASTDLAAGGAAVAIAAIGRGPRPVAAPHVHGPGCGHDHSDDHGHDGPRGHAPGHNHQ